MPLWACGHRNSVVHHVHSAAGEFARCSGAPYGHRRSAAVRLVRTPAIAKTNPRRDAGVQCIGKSALFRASQSCRCPIVVAQIARLTPGAPAGNARQPGPCRAGPSAVKGAAEVFRSLEVIPALLVMRLTNHPIYPTKPRVEPSPDTPPQTPSRKLSRDWLRRQPIGPRCVLPRLPRRKRKDGGRSPSLPTSLCDRCPAGSLARKNFTAALAAGVYDITAVRQLTEEIQLVGID